MLKTLYWFRRSLMWFVGTLGGTLVPTLCDALSETGVSPAVLKVGIAESVMMENVEDTAEQLLEVTRLGVEISVDDFGTGFSSLGHFFSRPCRRRNS